jgi:xylem cysteine proteinase
MSRNYKVTLVLLLGLVLAAIISATSSSTSTQAVTKLTDKQAQNLFVHFMKQHDKIYETAELFRRLAIFRENVDWMLAWNADKTNTHTVGINFFADLAPEEWVQFKGVTPPADWSEPDYEKLANIKDEDDVELQQIRKDHNTFRNSELADKVDWNEKGVMLPIRNQGTCGSCYTYSAMAAVEALFKITYPEEDHKYFSVQQALDCTGPKYGCNYCGGGWMASVFEYLVDTKGVCLDEDYPYKNRRTACKDSQCERAFSFQKYRVLSGAKDTTILEHLNVNPHAIAVTSGTREFMYYKSGVITYCGSPNAQVDHAVASVGYDLTAPTPYLLIRNSWSENWGEKGHVRVGIGKNSNICKHRSNVSYPVLVNPQSSAISSLF